MHGIFLQRFQDVYTNVLRTNIFWLYSCYFGKIKVCVVTKILLHGFHLQLIIN